VCVWPMTAVCGEMTAVCGEMTAVCGESAQRDAVCRVSHVSLTCCAHACPRPPVKGTKRNKAEDDEDDD
jgi:hypothetical protein